MDDVDRIVVVQDEHDLKGAAVWSSPPHEPLGIGPFERVRLPRRHHDVLSFFGGHAVAGEVLYVPVVPSELRHALFLIQESVPCCQVDDLSTDWLSVLGGALAPWRGPGGLL